MMYLNMLALSVLLAVLFHASLVFGAIGDPLTCGAGLGAFVSMETGLAITAQPNPRAGDSLKMAPLGDCDPLQLWTFGNPGPIQPSLTSSVSWDKWGNTLNVVLYNTVPGGGNQQFTWDSALNRIIGGSGHLLNLDQYGNPRFNTTNYHPFMWKVSFTVTQANSAIPPPPPPVPTNANPATPSIPVTISCGAGKGHIFSVETGLVLTASSTGGGAFMTLSAVGSCNPLQLWTYDANFNFLQGSMSLDAFSYTGFSIGQFDRPGSRHEKWEIFPYEDRIRNMGLNYDLDYDGTTVFLSGSGYHRFRFVSNVAPTLTTMPPTTTTTPPTTTTVAPETTTTVAPETTTTMQPTTAVPTTTKVPSANLTGISPVITRAVEIQSLKRATTTYIAIFGAKFGAPHSGVHLTVKIGQFLCVNIKHISDGEIHCAVTNGFGSNLEVVVTRDGLSSSFHGLLAFVGGAPVRFDFTATSTTGPTCDSPRGSSDIINSEICNCWSGFAPSNSLYTDCDKHAVCPGRIVSNNVVSQYAPSRPTTHFSNDRLLIKQTMPIVKGRRDTHIQFVIPSIDFRAPVDSVPGTLGEKTCSYPGNMWTKSVSELDCLDEFTASLPWSQHGLCGFVEDTDPSHLTVRVYRSLLVTSSTETFKATDGSLRFRKLQNAHMLTVSFKREITVYATSSVVSSTFASDPALEVELAGDSQYDMTTKELYISLLVTSAWPYKINGSSLVANWSKSSDSSESGVVPASATLVTVQSGDNVCNSEISSDCVQTWILTLDASNVCNLKGTVDFFNVPLVCRNPESNTPAPCPSDKNSASFALTMADSMSLCGNSDDDVEASAGLDHTLESFYDQTFTAPENMYQMGDMVYFKLAVTDSLASLDSVTINQIVVKNLDASKTDYLYYVLTPGELSGAVIEDFVNVTAEVRNEIVSPGEKAVLAFQFKIHSQLNVTQMVDPSTAQHLSVEVTVDLFYHGNQKRTIVTSAGSVPTVSYAHISFYGDDTIINDVAAEENGDDAELFDLFQESSASSVFASCALVFALIFSVLVM